MSEEPHEGGSVDGGLRILKEKPFSDLAAGKERRTLVGEQRKTIREQQKNITEGIRRLEEQREKAEKDEVKRKARVKKQLEAEKARERREERKALFKNRTAPVLERAKQIYKATEMGGEFPVDDAAGILEEKVASVVSASIDVGKKGVEGAKRFTAEKAIPAVKKVATELKEKVRELREVNRQKWAERRERGKKFVEEKAIPAAEAVGDYAIEKHKASREDTARRADAIEVAYKKTKQSEKAERNRTREERREKRIAKKEEKRVERQENRAREKEKKRPREARMPERSVVVAEKANERAWCGDITKAWKLFKATRGVYFDNTGGRFYEPDRRLKKDLKSLPKEERSRLTQGFNEKYEAALVGVEEKLRILNSHMNDKLGSEESIKGRTYSRYRKLHGQLNRIDERLRDSAAGVEVIPLSERIGLLEEYDKLLNRRYSDFDNLRPYHKRGEDREERSGARTRVPETRPRPASREASTPPPPSGEAPRPARVAPAPDVAPAPEISRPSVPRVGVPLPPGVAPASPELTKRIRGLEKEPSEEQPESGELLISQPKPVEERKEKSIGPDDLWGAVLTAREKANRAESEEERNKAKEEEREAMRRFAVESGRKGLK